MTNPYQSGALTRQPFSKNNSSVTGPLYCACTHNPLGAYANRPFCHGNELVNGIETVATLRSPQQTLAFGPEIYQGHYGMAYKLRFPDYGGPLYQYEQCQMENGTFAPCACTNNFAFRPTMPEFNTGAGNLAPNGRYVIMGSRTNPYFRVFNAPSAPSNQQMSQ